MENLAKQKIKDIVATGHVTAAMDKSKRKIFPVSIDPAEGEGLQEIVQQEKPHTIIETGLGYGFAALNVFAAKKFPVEDKFRFITIDPNQEKGFANIGLQLLRESEVLKYVEFHETPSEIVLPHLLEDGRQADFAVVDGNHHFEHVFVDLFYLGRILKPGSLIFLDDLQLPGIRKVTSFFINNLGWKMEKEVHSSPYHHWGTLRTRNIVLERNFDAFTNF